MGPLGFTEILFILLLALLLFGPKRLPELGRAVGRGPAEFRRASNDLRATIEDEGHTRAPAATREPPGPAPGSSSTAPASCPMPTGADPALAEAEPGQPAVMGFF